MQRQQIAEIEEQSKEASQVPTHPCSGCVELEGLVTCCIPLSLSPSLSPSLSLSLSLSLPLSLSLSLLHTHTHTHTLLVHLSIE
jgi:hypothetical protein